jgi:putative intracellular protease/amidase
MVSTMSCSTYSGIEQSREAYRTGRRALRVRSALVRGPVAVLVLCLLAACSGAGAGRGDGHGASPGTAAAQTVKRPTIPAALAKAGWQCLAPARPIVVTLPEALPVAILGSSQRAVVLSDESDETACSWVSLAATLEAAGYQVALYDYTGDPRADLTSVAAYLRRTGASCIALVGASEGAKTSIVVAAGLSPPPNAVVSLSAEEALLGTDVAPYAARLQAATLFVTAQDDPFGAATASIAYYRTTPAADKQLLVRPGMAHGTELLSDPAVRQALLDFLASHDG